VRLLVEELAAHSMLRSQVADRLRSCQHLNGQVSTVTLGQPCCCTNTLVYTRTTAESPRVPSFVLPAPTRLARNAALNHAEESIEERIVHLHRNKRDPASELLDGAEVSACLSEDELLDLIRA